VVVPIVLTIFYFLSAAGGDGQAQENL